MLIEDSQAGKAPLLLCDEMLKRLCRWLRAAGHDCAMLASGSADRDIVHLARQESRLIITRDRQFLHYRNASGFVLLLRAQVLEDQAEELSRALSIDWLYRPFSRCLVCNTPLVRAGEVERCQLKVRLRDDEPLWLCPGCHRNYWSGSHVQRMYRCLEGWNDKFIID
jgi:uncharacterized protein